MIESFAGNERVSLKRRRRVTEEIKVIGRAWVEKFDRETGAFLECTEKRLNTILQLPLLVDLIDGSSGAHLSANYSTLRISATSGGPTTAAFKGADSVGVGTAQEANGYAMRWSFYDDTSNTYQADYLELWNGDNDAPANSAEDGSAAVAVARFNAAFGFKPNSQNWRYHYEIELYSDNANLLTNCHRRMMQAITGNSASAHFTTSSVRMQPKTAGGTNVGSPIVPTRTTGNNYIEFVFTSGDGENLGAWDRAVVTHTGGGGTVDIRDGGVRSDGSSAGTKLNDEEFEWTWRYTFST